LTTKTTNTDEKKNKNKASDKKFNPKYASNTSSSLEILKKDDDDQVSNPKLLKIKKVKLSKVSTSWNSLKF